MLAILLATVLCASPFAKAADDPAAAAARATLERIQTLRKERPNDGALAFYQAFIHASLGERDAVLELLRSLKGRKLGLIPARGAGFDGVWEDSEFQKIRTELADEEAKTPDAPVAFRLRDPKLIPEGIAYDAKGDHFFIGSVAQRKIVVTDGKAEPRDFSGPNDKLDTVLGLAVDEPRGHLLAVSTNGFLDEAKTARRNDVLRYDLKSAKMLERIAVPDAMQLNDLVVTHDGTLYVTDSAGGAVFRKKPDEKELKFLGTAGALRGANGIALAADGALYVAISTGVARVNIETGEPTRLPQPDTVVTGGCDGLYWHDGDLLGIQNSTNPGRVIRIALEEKGTRIAGLSVLQSHHHSEFQEPTTGAIGRGALHVIANSYVANFQPDGTLKNPDELKPTGIVAVPLKR